MLGDIPFEDQPEITDWFYDSLYLREGELIEDRSFIQQVQFGWIKNYCECLIAVGVEAPPIIEVIELIERDKELHKLFTDLATCAARASLKKDFIEAATLREAGLGLGEALILHVRTYSDSPESLFWFCLMEH
ncbi:hypothetical protein [Pseudomonas amygdali]|uniref:hypothetical protein n=1 Tax=Pseudomonas amygdali TaxID=47877 RepID=UPI0006B9E59A|nr:hypothetical protein [Pseudomonas amygdali]